jgi:hypothetical protein
MDLWTNFEGQRYHVLGLTISDPDLIKRTKNVVIACAALAVISVLTCLIEFKVRNKNTSAFVQVVLGLISSLSAPAFGYLGARRGSATLMCLFVALMAVLVGVSVTFILGVLTVLTTFDWTLLTAFYALLWVACGFFSAWAAYNGNKLFAKLLQGEQIIEQTDPEIGLPEIDTQLPVFETANETVIGRKRRHSFDENIHELKPTNKE